jgi:hypothetical protein
MAEPELDDPQVDAGLQEVGGPGMAQRVDGSGLAHPCVVERIAERFTDPTGADGSRGGVVLHASARPGRKEPDRVAMGAPLAAEQGERARGQGDVAGLEALAAADLELHAGAVDPGDLQVDAFADAQAAGVDGGEAGVVGGPVDVVKNPPDFLDAEHDGQGLGGAGTKQVKPRPGTLERHLEEELEGRNGNGSR